MAKGFFVVGTDTGVGKTTFCCALIRKLVSNGYKTVGMKPIASGVDGSINDDLEQLKLAGNVFAENSVLSPYAFCPPIAPHIAAAQNKTKIELSVVSEAFTKLSLCAEIIVVEGVGGFRVPISENKDMADLAAILSLPLILVVGMRLGCINHALLTYEAIKNRNVPLIAWVANQIDPNMPVFEENVRALKIRLGVPLMGVIPHPSKVTNHDWLNLEILGLPIKPQI